jgi:hypothetical protein
MGHVQSALADHSSAIWAGIDGLGHRAARESMPAPTGNLLGHAGNGKVHLPGLWPSDLFGSIPGSSAAIRDAGRSSLECLGGLVAGVRPA